MDDKTPNEDGRGESQGHTVSSIAQPLFSLGDSIGGGLTSQVYPVNMVVLGETTPMPYVVKLPQPGVEERLMREGEQLQAIDTIFTRSPMLFAPPLAVRVPVAEPEIIARIRNELPGHPTLVVMKRAKGENFYSISQSDRYRGVHAAIEAAHWISLLDGGYIDYDPKMTNLIEGESETWRIDLDNIRPIKALDSRGLEHGIESLFVETTNALEPLFVNDPSALLCLRTIQSQLIQNGDYTINGLRNVLFMTTYFATIAGVLDGSIPEESVNWGLFYDFIEITGHFLNDDKQTIAQPVLQTVYRYLWQKVLDRRTASVVKHKALGGLRTRRAVISTDSVERNKDLTPILALNNGADTSIEGKIKLLVPLVAEASAVPSNGMLIDLVEEMSTATTRRLVERAAIATGYIAIATSDSIMSVSDNAVRFAELMQSIERVDGLNGTLPEDSETLGAILDSIGKGLNALEYYDETLVRRNPRKAVPVDVLALGYVMQKSGRDAIESARRMLYRTYAPIAMAIAKEPQGLISELEQVRLRVSDSTKEEIALRDRISELMSENGQLSVTIADLRRSSQRELGVISESKARLEAEVERLGKSSDHWKADSKAWQDETVAYSGFLENVRQVAANDELPTAERLRKILTIIAESKKPASQRNHDAAGNV